MTYQEKFDGETLSLDIEWNVSWPNRDKKKPYTDTLLFATESVSNPGKYESAVCIL